MKKLALITSVLFVILFLSACTAKIVPASVVNKVNKLESDTVNKSASVPAASSTAVSETPAASSTAVDCSSSDSCFSNYVKTCTPASATISNQGLIYKETVKGYAGNNCLLSLIYTNSPLPVIIGKEMTCRVPQNELANFKNYLQGEKMKQACAGSLIDYLIQAGAK